MPRARRRRPAARWRRGRRSSPSARPGSTTTASAAAASPTWNGSASASASTSAPAAAAGLPLVIHTRSASRRHAGACCARKAGRRGAGGVFHCFTETADVARAALDLGFHISFSGHPDLQDRDRAARGRALRAARSLPDRDRQPLPRAGAVSRQDQHAGLRALGGAPAGRHQAARCQARSPRRRSQISKDSSPEPQKSLERSGRKRVRRSRQIIDTMVKNKT